MAALFLYNSPRSIQKASSLSRSSPIRPQRSIQPRTPYIKLRLQGSSRRTQDSIQKSSITTFPRTIPRTGCVSSSSLTARGSLLAILFGFQLARGRYTTCGFFQSTLPASALSKTRGRLEASYTLPFRQCTLRIAYFRIIGSTYRRYVRPRTFSLEGSSASYLLLYQPAIGLRIRATYRICSRGTQQITTLTSCVLSTPSLT